MTLALGEDCLAEIALLRAEPGVFGRAALDPTVSWAMTRWSPTQQLLPVGPQPQHR
jgi:hypothetical protein